MVCHHFPFYVQTRTHNIQLRNPQQKWFKQTSQPKLAMVCQAVLNKARVMRMQPFIQLF